MSLLMIAAGTAPITDPVYQPEMVSFCVVSDDAGGQLKINMEGINDPTVTHAVDLATFFGVSAVDVAPLSRAFRSIYPPASGATLLALAVQQIVKNLDVNIVPISGAAGNIILGVDYDAVVTGSAQVPYLVLTSASGEGGVGTWRVDLRLRHSITN